MNIQIDTSEVDLEEYNSQISPTRILFLGVISVLIIVGMTAAPFIFKDSLYVAVLLHSILYGVAFSIPHYTKATDSLFHDRESEGISKVLKMLTFNKDLGLYFFSCSSIVLDYVRFIIVLSFVLTFFYVQIAINIGFSIPDIFALLIVLSFLPIIFSAIFVFISLCLLDWLEITNPISKETFEAHSALTREFGVWPNSTVWSDELYREMLRVCYEDSDYEVPDRRCVDAAINLYRRQKNLA